MNRWFDGWTRRELAEHYGKSIDAIQNYFQALRHIDFKVVGLPDDERCLIKGAHSSHLDVKIEM